MKVKMARPFAPPREEPMELMSDRRHTVSWVKLSWLLVVNILRLAYVEYVLHSLFYHNLVDGVYRQASVLVALFAAVVASGFAVRILVINREHRLKSMLVMAVAGIINHHYFLFATKSQHIMVDLVFDLFTLMYVAVLIPPLLLQTLVAEYAVRCKVAELKNQVEECERYHGLMERADLDAGFMSEMDCYLRAAVQQIVQCAIFFHGHGDFTRISVAQQISIIMSFALMPWFITSFQGTMAVFQYNSTVPLGAKIVSYLSNLCIMVSRIVSIGCAAAFWPLSTGTAVLFHYAGAVIWVYKQTEPTDFFCNSNAYHVVFSLVFGQFYIFRPMNLGEESSRFRYLSFYLISFVENGLALVVWYFSDENGIAVAYRVIVIFTTYTCFVVGVSLRVLYYVMFSPGGGDVDETEPSPEDLPTDD